MVEENDYFQEKLTRFAQWSGSVAALRTLNQTLRQLLPLFILSFVGVASSKIFPQLSIGPLLVTISLKIASLWGLTSVVLYYSNEKKTSDPLLLGGSIASFLLLGMKPTTPMVFTAALGSENFLVALLWGLVSVKFLLWVREWTFKKENFLTKLWPLLGPLSLLLASSLLLQGASFFFWRVSFLTVMQEGLAPLLGIFDYIGVIYLILVWRLAFWSYGLHSSALDFILRPLGGYFLLANLVAWQHEVALPHLLTYGALSAFGNFSGSGVTIGLVLASFLSKERRPFGQMAFKPAVMGINEMVLFGLPVVGNKFLRWPFIFGGALLGWLPFGAMRLGLLAYPKLDMPAVPFFLEGLCVTGDWRALYWQALQLFLSFIFYGFLLKFGGKKVDVI
ncbi:PTS transporter subunit EIIC [Enterococcus nangangensis]